MTLPVVFRRRFQHDLDAGFDWYEEQRPGLGEEFLSAVQSTLKSGRAQSAAHRTRPEALASPSKCTLIVAQAREVNKALLLPDIKEKLRNAGGVEPWITTSEEFAGEIRSEYAKYATLVKDVGAKID